ncbi:MAG: THUMP domain-containing protein, partial [Planctomycetota bacterium]
MPFPQTMSLLATCAFGLEAITRRELSTLGIEARIEGSGRVAFEGNNETMMRATLWLRTADRVLIRLAEMPCEDFDTLFETVKAMRWGDWLPVDASFPVKGRSIRSTLSSVPACQRAVKRAIVDAMRRDHGAATLAETGAEFKIEIGLLNNVATITVDTTGRSLHRRGYRTDISGAPLKETMAAALVLLTFWKPDRPLVDPFCGSGTIPIEAALIGRGIAPGRKRENAFMTWPNFNAELWSSLISDADANASEKLPNRLIGRDIDTRVLSAARDNAARAGVEDDVHFEPGDAVSFTSRRRFGCLISNPPYGMRLGGGSSQPDRAWNRNRQGDEQLDDLYASLPGMLRHLPTWSSYFLTAYPGFESVIGRSADRRRKLYNGRIECTYFQFHGPKPIQETRPLSDPSTLAASQTVTLVHSVGSAAFGQLDAKATHQAELFATRLRKRQKHLRRWPTRRGITCYRLYERDIPEIPLVVDRYEDHLHLIEFERPHDRDPAQHANWLDLMAKTAGDCLEIPSKQVFLKRRGRQRGHDQHQRLAQSNHRL